MSIFKLIQIGNSVGVILTKELLARLDLEKKRHCFRDGGGKWRSNAIAPQP